MLHSRSIMYEGPSESLLRLCERFAWTCHLCGGKVPREFHPEAPMSPTRDHIIPKARIRRKRPADKVLSKNIRLAHRYCNNKRGVQGPNRPREMFAALEMEQMRFEQGSIG